MKTFFLLVFVSNAAFYGLAQNVGIGTTTPKSKLHVVTEGEKQENEVLRLQGKGHYISFFDPAGNYSGYLWNRGNGSMDLGTPAGSKAPVYITANGITQATFKPDGSLGIGINDPAFRLDVLGRIRLRYNNETPGLWLNNALNTASPAFIGMASDNLVGMYGSNGAGWSLLMNTTTGVVSAPNTMRAGQFQYMAPVTRHHSLSREDFSEYNGDSPVTPRGAGDLYWAPRPPELIGNIPTGSLSGPIHLPDGANIVSIAARIYDNDTEKDAFAVLESRSTAGETGGGWLVRCFSSGTPGYTTISGTPTAPITIDNGAYMYTVLVSGGLTNWDPNKVRFWSVVVTYTMSSPN